MGGLKSGAGTPKTDTQIIAEKSLYGKDKSDIQTVLAQMGDVNLSKEHKKNYKVQKSYLLDLLSHNITPAVFKDGTRHGGKDNVDRILGYMVLDHDGDIGEFLQLIIKLRECNISYITWASPSRESKIKEGLLKTRIVIPTHGLTKGMYAKQFLQLLIELGQEIDIKTDETAQEITRFFYPPCMDGIREPHIKKNGKWVVLTPKPRNQDMTYAIASVTAYAGKPYRAKKRFTEAMSRVIEEKQAFAYSERESIYLPDDTVITHCGGRLGTFEELVKFGGHYRCDCPFNGEHGTSSKDDSAFLSEGHIICSSNTHSQLIGRSASEEIVFPDLEELTYGY